MHKSSVTRAFQDDEARELRFLWDLAADLDRNPPNKEVVCEPCIPDEVTTMTRHFTIRKMLRMTPNRLLQDFFQRLGHQLLSVDWRRVPERSDEVADGGTRPAAAGRPR